MADTNTTVIIDVSLNSADATQKAKDLGASIKAVKEEQKELKASGKETDIAYQSNVQNLRLLNAEQKAYINIANSAEGSNNQLRAQLSLLTQQYNALGKEERDNTTAGKALTIQIKGISDELKKNESAVGDNRRNVGNYAEALGAARTATSSLIGETTRNTIGFKQAGAVTDVLKNQINNFREAINESRVAQQELQKATQLAAEAQEIANAATQKATTIGFKYAQGEATAAQAELAKTEAVNANIVATGAQTAATEAQVVATNAASNATKVFKVALASTGIGAIVIIVVALLSYLSKFDPIMDRVEQAFAAVGAVVNRVSGIVVDFFRNITSVGDFLTKFGKFLANPIEGFKNLATEIRDAANAAIELKKAQQDLEDQVKIQEIRNARAIQQIKELTLQSRNRSLTEQQRQALLNKASKLDEDNFKRQTEISKEKNRQALEDLKVNSGVTDAEIKNIERLGLAEALRLKDTRRITDEQIDVLKEAELEQIKNLEESTNREEKRQNLRDALAEKAQAAAEKRAAKLKELSQKAEEADQARVESSIRAAQSTISIVDSEIAAVNREIDEKVKKYKAYGKTTEALEKERVARIKEITKAYNEEVARDTADALRNVEDLFINTIQDRDERELAQIAVQNERKLQAQDELIAATLERQQKGEAGLTELLDAQQRERDAILSVGQDEINAKNQEKLDTLNTREIERAQATKEAKDKIREEEQALTDQGLAFLQGVFDKTTAIGKTAFLAEKAFAVARIVIKTQEALAANRLAEQLQNAALSAVPGGIFAALANSIAKQAERTKIIISGALSGAAVVATAIQGFSTGGVFQSDGKGAVLPGYSRTDNTNAKLRSGEAVIVAEAARDPKALRALSAINEAYGGRPLAPSYAMARGGIAPGGFATDISNGVNSVSDIANLVVAAVSNIKILTDVRDVTTAQQRNSAAAVNGII